MIVLSKENALLQVSELTKQHPLLSITESNNSFIRLRGEIDVYRTAFNYTLDRSYHVEIVIPINSSELPIVKDLDGIIDSSYPHRYGNGELCLETDSAIRWHFLDGFHLEEWVKEYVEPYFFSYEYYSRFGIFPFGERPHGLEGILDSALIRRSATPQFGHLFLIRLAYLQPEPESHCQKYKETVHYILRLSSIVLSISFPGQPASFLCGKSHTRRSKLCTPTRRHRREHRPGLRR